MPWGAEVVVAQVLYLGVILTSRRAWRHLATDVLAYRSDANFRGPLAKAEERVLLFLKIRLSVTARGQVWNTYIVTLFSYVSQVFDPTPFITARINRLRIYEASSLVAGRWDWSRNVGASAHEIPVGPRGAACCVEVHEVCQVP